MTKKYNPNILVSMINSWEQGLSNLGNCIVQFQRIEDVLESCISAMIGRNKKIGKIVTTEMSYRAKVSVYRALLIHHNKSTVLQDEMQELLSRINWAEQERNQLVHSLWDSSEKNPGTITRSKASCRKHGLKIDSESILPDDLDELARLFEGIATDIIYLTGLYFPKLKI